MFLASHCDIEADYLVHLLRTFQGYTGLGTSPGTSPGCHLLTCGMKMLKFSEE